MQASLGEGNTPLVPSTHIGPSLGLSRLFFKLETCNPTGSYKDRFIAAEMSRLLERGVKACVATSSGNTGASLASYCARYQIACAIVVSRETPEGKLAQMRAHGARLFLVKDFITSPDVTDNVLQCLQRIAAERNVAMVVSAFRYCPEGMRGVQSISAELREQLSGGPDHVFVPIGGGGMLAAVCRGFAETPGPQPKVHAVQPRGCPTLVDAFERGGVLRGDLPEGMRTDNSTARPRSAPRASGCRARPASPPVVAMGYLQCNFVVLRERYAYEFLLYCKFPIFSGGDS